MQIAIQIAYTTCYTCSRPVYMTAAELAQYKSNERSFHCLDGHRTYFPRQPPEAQRRLQRDLEAALAARAQVDRQRLEAEKRAAQQEEARLKAERELNATKRTLKRGLKVAAHVIKNPPQKRSAKGKFVER